MEMSNICQRKLKFFKCKILEKLRATSKTKNVIVFPSKQKYVQAGKSLEKLRGVNPGLQ